MGGCVADDTRADADDGALLVRAAQGDGAAFLRLAAAYRPRIIAFLARLADPRAVALDEVAQQALDDAYEGLPHLRNLAMAGFRAWLFTIARRRLLDTLAAQERAISLETLVTPPTLVAPEPPSDLADLLADLAALFEEAGLSREVRAMLLLRAQGASIAEIAARLGKTTTAVERALGRARRALRILWQESHKEDT